MASKFSEAYQSVAAVAPGSRGKPGIGEPLNGRLEEYVPLDRSYLPGADSSALGKNSPVALG